MIYMLLICAMWCLLVKFVKQAERDEAQKAKKERGEQNGMRTISSFRRSA